MSFQDEMAMNIARRTYRSPTQAAVGSIITSVIGFMIAFAIGLLLTVYQAYILTFMWRWFAEPAGIPPIDYTKAVGLILLVTFIIHNPLAASTGDDDKETPAVVKGFVNLGIIAFWATLSWGVAALWHFWLL